MKLSFLTIIYIFILSATSISYAQDVEIIGVGIAENGVTSAYESHQFRLQNNTENQISNVNWTFTLPLEGGGNSILSQKSDVLEFDIPAIDDETKYDININSDISGKVSFSGIMNGNLINVEYTVSLDLKPKIKSVQIIKKESNAPLRSYNVYYSVEYCGSNELFISVEEEYSTSQKSFYVREPFFANIVSRNITAPFYAWIDIKAENKYGSDTYTIELPPYETGSVPKIDDTKNTENYTHIVVYNMNGIKLVRAARIDDLSELEYGMYILNFYNGNECVERTKFFKR